MGSVTLFFRLGNKRRLLHPTTVLKFSSFNISFPSSVALTKLMIPIYPTVYSFMEEVKGHAFLKGITVM